MTTQWDREESLRDDAPPPPRLVGLTGCTTSAERRARLDAVLDEALAVVEPGWIVTWYRDEVGVWVETIPKAKVRGERP